MKKQKIKIKNPVTPKNEGKGWIFVIVILSFFLSISMNVISTSLMPENNLIIAMVILLVLILIGVVFDIVGVAVAAAEETPFHSMASRQVKAAPQAIWLIRNADKVSNICNDVIGDIVGIISGVGTSVVSAAIVRMYNFDGVVVSLLLAGLVASLTIGGKALGKGIAMSKCNSIIYTVAKVISVFSKKRKKKKS